MNLVLVLVTGVFGSVQPRAPASRQAELEPLRGVLQLRIDDPAEPGRRHLRLDQPGVLPLKAGDRFRVEVKLNRPAYVYLVWLGSDGKVAPIYPWAPGHWERRPAAEVKTDRLDLPPQVDQAWEIPAGAPGLETIVLLVRDESPLPRGVDLSRLATGLPGRTHPTPDGAVWVENGREVTLDSQGRAAPTSKTRKSDDPVLRLRRILQDKVRPLGEYSQAVLFPNQGGP